MVIIARRMINRKFVLYASGRMSRLGLGYCPGCPLGRFGGHPRTGVYAGSRGERVLAGIRDVGACSTNLGLRTLATTDQSARRSAARVPASAYRCPGGTGCHSGCGVDRAVHEIAAMEPARYVLGAQTR